MARGVPKGTSSTHKYTPAEKAIGVDCMIRHRGHCSTECWREICDRLKRKDIPKTTICGWYAQWKKAQMKEIQDVAKTDDKITIALVEAAKEPLDRILEDVARRFLEHAANAEVIQKMNGRDALQGAATAIDRVHMLRDIPPELASLMPILIKVFKLHGDYARQAIEALCSQLESIVVPKASFLIPAGDYIEGEVRDVGREGEGQGTGVLVSNEAVEQSLH